MRVYLDTGIFIDYLSARIPGGSKLRSAGRRGRSVEQVIGDAEQVLDLVSRRHAGATSALTYYEVEEALYKSLSVSSTGGSRFDIHRVAAARSIVPQTAIAVQFFRVGILDLTSEIVNTQLRTVELQTYGIRAADALHVATASHWDADIILTTDEGMMRLDKMVRNRRDNLMRCCDTDGALAVLRS